MSINPNQAPGYMPPSGAPAGGPAYTTPPSSYPPYAPPAPPAGSGMKIPVLFGIVIALLAANVYLFYQVSQLRTQLGQVHDSMLGEMDKMRETSSVSMQNSRRTVDTLRDQLAVERRQARLAAGEAKTEALKKVDETRARLEQAQAQEQQQISQVKEAADTANSKVAEVNTEVTTVKGDVATTKSELEKTVADLKRTHGDIDGQGVLIATNGKELSALRALGERNYVEFTIKRAKQSQKVGDVLVMLKKTDPKHNRYTIELTADDKTVEKKDRTINEPLQFMTSKAKQPYELVVNDVKKDQIVGYLSIPKVLSSRSGSSEN